MAGEATRALAIMEMDWGEKSEAGCTSAALRTAC